jgi:hypothetical protein
MPTLSRLVLIRYRVAAYNQPNNNEQDPSSWSEDGSVCLPMGELCQTKMKDTNHLCHLLNQH